MRVMSGEHQLKNLLTAFDNLSIDDMYWFSSTTAFSVSDAASCAGVDKAIVRFSRELVRNSGPAPRNVSLRLADDLESILVVFGGKDERCSGQ